MNLMPPLYPRLFITLLFIVLASLVIAQTNPVPQAMPFTFSSQTGSTLSPGMAMHRFGTTSTAIPLTRLLTPGNGDLPYVAGSTSGGWNDQGVNGIGILASGSQAAGALIVSINTLGKTNILVQWTVRTILQQAARDNSIALQYRLGTSGNFIDVGTSTTFSSTGTSNNDFQTFSETLPTAAENSPEVQVRWIYWESVSTSGSRDRLAVDDINIHVGCTPPTSQPSALGLSSTYTTINGSFSPAGAGTTPADSYLVIRSTANTLSVQPVSGTAYAVDDVLGNGIVVSIGNNISFSCTNLPPSTTYYFFIYSYTTTQTCYNISAPLTGSIATNTPPACTPPSVPASNLFASAITGSSMVLNYTRGNGDNILIVSRTNSSVNQNPINGVNYTAGSTIGSGNTVIYNGPQNTFNYSGLTQNTNYYFALYEYFNTNFCYNLAPLTGNFTTVCTTPVDVTSLNGVPGNGNATITWSNPTASCFDEVLVIASNSTITAAGNTFIGPANTVYTTPNQVVFRGLGSRVTVTGLTNGTTYYFKVFTKNAGVYSAGIQTTATPFNPALGFMYLYGNLHSHSSYSDGNKENTSKKPLDDYKYARDANCMDFLGISEHNHSGAGMNISNYPLGYADCNAINGLVGPTGNSLVTLWGMEWGVISGGGHVLVYGFNDQLIGWEPGNYNIYCAKGDYVSLFNIVNSQPDAFATLAHPQSSDYGNINGSAYGQAADNAIYGVAIESGPAFSIDTVYADFPSPLGFLGYYKSMLAKGYHLGAQMDGDNHYMTFGRQSTNRMVVLSTSKSRADVISAIRAMRFYASNDCNVKVDYKCYSTVMGGNLVHAGLPSITIAVSDPDAGETVSSIDLYGGQVGASVPTSPIKSYSGLSSITFDNTDPLNVQPDNTTYYYYAIITQGDGNKVVTSPIWYTRNNTALPISLIFLTGIHNRNLNTILLSWATAQELNSKVFIIQRSNDNGHTFTDIGSVNANGATSRTSNYGFTDLAPLQGANLYRLKEVDIDGTYQFSKVILINIGIKNNGFYSIYPSPAHDFTYLNSTNSLSRNISVQLVDEAGRVLNNQRFLIDNNHPSRIDLRGLGKGVYFVRINENGVTATQKIVIE